MASSNPTPTPAPPPQPPASSAAASAADGPPKNPFMRYVAMGVTPVAIGALFLPPRRLDARQLLLGAVSVWGINQLAYELSGRGFGERMGRAANSLAGTELPEGARLTQERLRREREARDRRRILEQHPAGLSERELALLAAEEEARRDRERKGQSGALQRLWMGDQPPDWKQRREQEEREALADGGKGYWGLITDQVADVWSGVKKGEKKEGEEGGSDDNNNNKAAADAEKKKSDDKKP